MLASTSQAGGRRAYKSHGGPVKIAPLEGNNRLGPIRGSYGCQPQPRPRCLSSPGPNPVPITKWWRRTACSAADRGLCKFRSKPDAPIGWKRGSGLSQQSVPSCSKMKKKTTTGKTPKSNSITESGTRTGKQKYPLGGNLLFTFILTFRQHEYKTTRLRCRFLLLL